MNDYNDTILIGRATDDIKITKFENKVKYTFIVAINHYSNKKKYSDFIPVCFWKNEPFKELEKIRKGDNIIVNGRVSIHSYEKNDQKKWITEVVGRYVRVFKQNSETKDMSDLISLIKSNKALLDEITSSHQITFSDDLIAELIE